MKKRLQITLFLVSILTAQQTAAQKLDLTIDGNTKAADPNAIISSAFTSAHLILGYLSDKNDLQFSISAYMSDLKPGTYLVYDCKSAGECNEKMPDNNQIALLGPYPKDPMPAANLYRTAYYAPKLGIKPLTLTITSVSEKRITGTFSGTLAYVEQQKGGYDYHIVGKPTQITGSFNVPCSLR